MALVALYCRAITWVSRWTMRLVSIAAVAMVPVLCFEVLMRYAFGSATGWAVELCTLLLGPYFLLCGPYLLHIGGHVSVDILHARLAPRWARLVDCLTTPIIVLFAVTLLDIALPLAVTSFQQGETSFSSWNPPVWPVKAVLPVALGLLALQALAEFLRSLARLLGKADPCPAEARA